MADGSAGVTPDLHGPPSDPTFSETAAYTGGDPRPDPAHGRESAPDGRRFRVLRPHARGGLGAVFVALDADLNREVALKEIQDDHADDPGSRSRFLLEAEITGRLEHPGIVPIYALGAHDDGRPYYAMRLIRGDSLKEAIARFHADERLKADAGARSLELRKLLRRFLDVCNAVEYAHGRGVVHRDLKPSNVMIGRYGETLVVDWGLAKCVGGPDAGAPDEPALVPTMSGDSSETQPGAAIGTPAYMSPEQADGDLERLGPRSDVYSLGATLHHLLAGRPPRQGRDVRDVLAAARRGEFTPLRQAAPSIDRGLEAICAKAMAARPEDRYATARALADDVDRWMADEPVSARRDPWSTRAWRWLRRHRTAATAAGLLALIGAIGMTSSSLISAARARAELKDREAEGYRRQAIQNEAESFVMYGIHVFDRFRIDADTPGVNRELIAGLLAALERKDQDPEAAAQAARAARTILQPPAEDELRKRAEALKSFEANLRRGIEVIVKARREFPESRMYRVSLGRCYHLLASMHARPITDLSGYEALLSGRGSIRPEQRAELESMLALYDRAMDVLPAEGQDVREDWCATWLGRGIVVLQLGRCSEALLAFDRAVDFADGYPKTLARALGPTILKAAEVEQSHLPWSRGAGADHARAIRMAEAIAGHDGVSPDAVYNAACAFALASVDGSAADAERGRRADRAMEYLRRIAARGYFRPRPGGIFGLLAGKDTLNELRTDADLDPLRARPDFRELLADREAPAGPGTR